ncbi:hypothetical protein GH714_038972 [Hevea brasiliensis]|uniref:CCAAT-binding factor domain-containing protein n=1 Tax=Hevea brasiliensis TaxID=3981 RepID=A0A6A6LRC2_HEVBR|nr:hypothetical protein GH714_038972 [Hevea brasiliensis]
MASEKKKSKAKHTLKEVKTLGQQLLSSRTYVNNLPLLLTFVSPNFPPQYVLESLLSLQSFFTTLLPSLSSYSLKNTKKTSEEDDAELIYRTWLRSKFDDLVRLLIDLLFSEQADEALRQFVLDSLMEFVKVGNGGRFHSALYHRLLHTILHSSTPVDLVLDLLLSKYFKYIDVRYFTHISLAKLAKTLESKDNPDDKTKTADGDDESHSRASMDLCIHKIHYIMSHVPPLEVAKENSDYEMWSGSEFLSKKGETEAQNNNNGLSAANISKKMKLKFTKAWISFLRLPLPVDIYKENKQDWVYQIKFLLDDENEVVFDDDNLTWGAVAKAIRVKQNLLDTCLKSTLLPAYLAAAFTKKLSRLSLSVPPSGAVVIIALIHNLLRRHPSINCLVHRENDNENAADNSDVKGENARNANDSRTGSGTSAENLCVDHFNNEESNPAKSNALKSSLWEIDTLRHHYCPPVSRFVDSLKNDLTIRDKTTEVNIKDFSSSSYSTIFGEELRRRVKQVPLAFYKATPSLLFSDDFTGWTFKYEESKGSK